MDKKLLAQLPQKDGSREVFYQYADHRIIGESIRKEFDRTQTEIDQLLDDLRIAKQNMFDPEIIAPRPEELEIQISEFRAFQQDLVEMDGANHNGMLNDLENTVQIRVVGEGSANREQKQPWWLLGHGGRQEQNPVQKENKHRGDGSLEGASQRELGNMLRYFKG